MPNRSGLKRTLHCVKILNYCYFKIVKINHLPKIIQKIIFLTFKHLSCLIFDSPIAEFYHCLNNKKRRVYISKKVAAECVKTKTFSIKAFRIFIVLLSICSLWNNIQSVFNISSVIITTC